MNGKEFRVKMRGKVQVEDVTANEGTKAKPTEMLFNFCGLQLSCPFSWSHLSACVRMCVCEHMSGWTICCPGKRDLCVFVVIKSL